MSGLAGRVRTIPSWQVTLGAALFALGFLIAAQLRAEGPRVRYTSQERVPLVETALGLQATQETLKTRILALNEAITAALSEGQGSAALVRQLNAELELVRIAAGLIALEGPGVVLQLEDSTLPVRPDATEADLRVSGPDLRAIVDELWLAGAEAVAVNGERVAGSTAILDIGGSILVNSAYLTPPYQVAAIGSPDLYDRLTAQQGFVEFIRTRAQAFGIRVSFATPERVSVPAFAGSVTLRYGRPAATPAPTAAPTAAP